MDFYILDENFIEFLSYIDIDHTGIIPMWEWYVPSGHFFSTNSIAGEAKCSWFLWQEEGIFLAIVDAIQW